MHKRQVSFKLFIITVTINLVFINTGFAQGFYPSNYSAQLRFGVRGAATQKDFWGYTDLFLPLYNSEDSILYGANDLLLFFNPKINISDFSSNEENLGLGVRYLAGDTFFDEGFILGGNFFYDTGYSQKGIRHNQVGFGFEFLSQVIDLRTNYYRPVSKVKTVDDTYVFAENSLNRNLYEEEPLRGYDAQVGVPVPYLANLIETWIYAGGYHYNSTIAEDIDGVTARLEINPSPFITFNFEFKEDDTFGSNTFIGAYISLPFDLGKFSERRNPFEGWQKIIRFNEGKRSLTERMTEPIIRDINIITKERKQSLNIHNLIYVDNSNDGDAQEDGSLSHPHNTLAEAFTNPGYQQGIWIYVRKGDGTSTGYTGNFTLSDDVVLWGQGFRYYSLGGDAYPVIDGGGAGSVITLADNNTVMGLKVQNGQTGILAADKTGITIKNNIIIGNGVGVGPGIRLTTTGTTVTSAAIAENSITNNGGNGIELISDDSSNLSVALSQNAINSNTIGSGVYLLSNDSSTLSINCNGNVMKDNAGGGIYLQSNANSTLNCALTHNQIYNNSLDGVHLLYLGTSVLTLDMGKGSLGAGGYNSAYDNTSDEIEDEIKTVTIKAENNYWGRITPSDNQFKADVDYTPWLESDPNL